MAVFTTTVFFPGEKNKNRKESSSGKDSHEKIRKKEATR